MSGINKNMEFTSPEILSNKDIINEYKLYETKDLPYINQEHIMNIRTDKDFDEKNTTAVFCFVFHKDKILLFEHAKDKSRAVDIPGGHIENNETLLEAVKREVLEETGYTIKNVEYCAVQEIELFGEREDGYKYPFPKSNMVFFSGMIDESVEKIEELFDDAEEAFWLDINDAKKILSNELKTILENV